MEGKELQESIKAAAQQYMEEFDVFSQENPPYVPPDGMALHFSRVYYQIDEGSYGWCYYPKHKTVEEMKQEESMRHACEHELLGEKMKIKICNCVHSGKEPGRNVHEDEYVLATMGVLGENIMEVLEGEFSFDEIIAGMEPEKREVIEEERRTARKELQESIKAGAQKYMESFDGLSKENPPYVPADGAALYFSRIYYWLENGRHGWTYCPGHKTVETMKREKSMRYAYKDSFSEENIHLKIYNCVYPGKEPGRKVQMDEFALAIMGALGKDAKEVLEGELSYEEILAVMNPEEQQAMEMEQELLRKRFTSYSKEQETMSKERFWKLIEEVNQETDPNNQDAILKATGRKLMELSAEEIALWDQISEMYMELADRNDLWRACGKAVVRSERSCPIDFRAGLISKGRDLYMQVLKNPEILETMNLMDIDLDFEPYGYVATSAYTQKKAIETEGLPAVLRGYWEWVMEEGQMGEEQYLRSYDKVYDIYQGRAEHPLSAGEKEAIRAETEHKEVIDNDWGQKILNMPC